MKKTKRRFALERQTIATLTPPDLEAVAGGDLVVALDTGTAWNCPSQVYTCQPSCLVCGPKDSGCSQSAGC